MAAIAGNFVNASPIADMSIFVWRWNGVNLQSLKTHGKYIERFFLD